MTGPEDLTGPEDMTGQEDMTGPEDMTDRFDSLRLLEALLFASADPLSAADLARHLPEGEDVEALLDQLAGHYASRGVNLVRVGRNWAFRTASDLGPRMRLESEVKRRLSRAAIETLAVIAYHQPVTRAEIEEIRGVGLSRGTLDTLLEAGWIGPKGRRRTPGRPVTWATTDGFLDHFGLESRDALPGLADLKAAGLLDSRPAIVTLGGASVAAPADETDETDEMGEAGEAEEESAAALDADFGEDLLPDVDPGVDPGAEPGADDEDSGAKPANSVP